MLFEHIRNLERIWQDYLGLSYTEVYNYRTSRTSKVKAMVKHNLADAHSKAAVTVLNV
jgi:hypothetical protein